jgi:molybdate transport system substrate-binding protein
MSLKTLFFLNLILALLAVGCIAQPTATSAETETISEAPTYAPAEPVELNVFAAASLTESFNEIGKLFEANHPNVTVVFNFAGSQQLVQQINEGAPADIFASANKKQMDVAIEAGNVVSGTQQTFAKNRLLVIFPKENPAGLKELKDLSNSGLKLVLAAKEVPVGQYSLDFLEKAAADPAFGATFKEDVLKNVVSYEDNVKAVLTKVALGEADGGIVYTSDITGQDTSKVGKLDIPDALNVIATYPIAPIKDSKNPDLAQAFIDLVLSQEGQELLAKYNFIPVK